MHKIVKPKPTGLELCIFQDFWFDLKIGQPKKVGSIVPFFKVYKNNKNKTEPTK